MLHKVEPKIRRMEYRLAFAPAPMTAEPDAFVSDDFREQACDRKNLDKSQEELALLAARVQELEQRLQERESSFRQQLEAETSAAFERGRRAEESHRTDMTKRMVESIEHALGEFASVAAVEDVDQQAEAKPDHEAEPGDDRQAHHQTAAKDDRDQREPGHERNAEGAFAIGLAATEKDHSQRDKNKSEECADVG